MDSLISDESLSALSPESEAALPKAIRPTHSTGATKLKSV